MEIEQIDKIEKLALEFRKALEEVCRERLYGQLRVFQSFPRGCCTYTADLLAQYLSENGINVLYTVNGSIPSTSDTHSWVVIEENIVVDITADQFNSNFFFRKYQPIPICCIVPENEYLYKMFDWSSDAKYGICSYCGENRILLEKLYREILKKIH